MAWKTKPPYNIPVNPAHPLANGLQGCWLFNEGEGLVANDISGNGNTGTLTGAPAWTTGNGGGNALSFDGADDIINCGSGASLDIAGNFTVEAIVYSTKASANCISSKVTGSGGTADGYILNANSGGNLSFVVYQADRAQKTATKAMTASVWTSCVGVYNGSSITAYVNGAAGTATTLTGYSQAAAQNFTIGKYSYINSIFFQGSISLVRIWNRALTASEVLSLYNDPYDMFLDPQINFLRGTATVTQGNTTATVTHGLGFVPSLVWLQPLSDSGKKWFITNRTSTTFQINLPAEAQADVSFNYGVA